MDSKGAGDQRGGDKEKKIDAPGSEWICAQHHGKPQNQQTAAADSKTGQETQNCADDQSGGK